MIQIGPRLYTQSLLPPRHALLPNRADTQSRANIIRRFMGASRIVWSWTPHRLYTQSLPSPRATHYLRTARTPTNHARPLRTFMGTSRLVWNWDPHRCSLARGATGCTYAPLVILHTAAICTPLKNSSEILSLQRKLHCQPMSRRSSHTRLSLRSALPHSPKSTPARSCLRRPWHT